MKLSRMEPEAQRSGPGIRSMIDWAFKSRVTERLVIAQFPNLSLGLYLLTKALDWTLSRTTSSKPGAANPSSAVHGVPWLGAILLTWWALDELIRGVNPWRRLLGLFGIASAVGSVLKLAT
jgi:hypothetical protein